jgi:hypothetical protein
MSVGTLQKASLAALLWSAVYFFTLETVYEFVWPTERSIAARRAGRLGPDVSPPLPATAVALICALPTGVISLLVVLYRSGTRHKR